MIQDTSISILPACTQPLPPRKLLRGGSPRRASLHLRPDDAIRRLHPRDRRLNRRLRSRLHHLAAQRRLHLRRRRAEERGGQPGEARERHAAFEILGRAGRASVTADRLRPDGSRAVERVERLEGRDERGGLAVEVSPRGGGCGARVGGSDGWGLHGRSLRETRDPLGGTKERRGSRRGIPRVHGDAVHGRGEDRVGRRVDVLSELDALATLLGLFAPLANLDVKVDGGDGDGRGRAARSALEEGGEPGRSLHRVRVVRNLRVGGVPLLVQGNLAEDGLVLRRRGGGGSLERRLLRAGTVALLHRGARGTLRESLGNLLGAQPLELAAPLRLALLLDKLQNPDANQNGRHVVQPPRRTRERASSVRTRRVRRGDAAQLHRRDTRVKGDRGVRRDGSHVLHEPARQRLERGRVAGGAILLGGGDHRGSLLENLPEHGVDPRGAVPLARAFADALRHAARLEDVHDVVEAAALHAQALGEGIDGDVTRPLRRGPATLRLHCARVVLAVGLVELGDDAVRDGGE